MYLDLSSGRRFGASGSGPQGRNGGWTVLLPFFNERDGLPAAIASLAGQTIPFTLVLIDNGSTDGSAEIAEAACRAHRLEYALLTERLPGKVAALRRGLGWVHSRWVATCGADTAYPPHYLAAAQEILARPGHVVAGAYCAPAHMSDAGRWAEAARLRAAARLLPRQCHAVGSGQAFCARALREAGGFDPVLWNFVLEDHEIAHRMLRSGRMGYSAEMWCTPSTRKSDRDPGRWTPLERLLYPAAAAIAGDWFFYTFLARRLQRRRRRSDRLRAGRHIPADQRTHSAPQSVS